MAHDDSTGDHSAPMTDPYRELFERSADAILVIRDGAFVDCNQAAVRMMRCKDRQQLLQTHPSELSPPRQPDGRDSFDKANEMMALALDRGSARFEWDHVRRGGEVFPVEVLLTAVRRGAQTELHVVWREISERRRLEEQLRHTQKMQAIGQLAGGIAHDFNNLLVAILGYGELLREVLDDQSHRDMANEICLAVDRATALTRQLLTFSQKRKVLRRVVNYSEQLAGMRALLQRVVGEQVHLRLRLDDDSIVVNADPSHLEQVVMNLAANARDAMPRGGELTVALDRHTVAAGAPLDLRPGSYAVLVVRDTGTGMSPEIAARAFEPFFTTKDPDRGTGIGLATVFSIVDQCGGLVELDSELHRGTTVRVYIPMVEAEVPEVHIGPQHAVRGTESILVVEDEPTVSTYVVRVLERAGYSVHAVADGLQALVLWENSPPDRFDLVLADVVMPGMWGPELVNHLRASKPSLKVLFMSGHARGALSGREVSDRLVNKPFSVHELTRVIREVLDGHEGPGGGPS